MKSTARLASLLVLATLPGCTIQSSQAGWFSSGSGNLKHEAREERRSPLELEPGSRLSVELPAGSVRVVVGEGPFDLRANLIARASSDERAREVLAASAIALERDSKGLSIRLTAPPDTEEKGAFQVSADLELTVPTGIQLEARTGMGRVEVEGAVGNSRLRSSFGEVRATGVRGALSAESGSGSVEVVDARGDEVRAKSSFGQVVLRDVEGQEVRAESGSGAVHGESIRAARIFLHTSFGEVRAQAVEGRLEAKSGSGGIRVEGFRGALDANSSFGTIGCEGDFSALSVQSGSGTVEVHAGPASRVEAPWKIHSNFGAVRLRVAPDFACELSAKTGFGSLDVGFPLTIEAGGLGKSLREVRGRIGAGGGPVSLTSGSGSISLVPHPR